MSIQWDCKCIVYFEFLSRTKRSIQIFSTTKETVKAIKEKRAESTNRKGIVFHQDNEKPHASFVTRGKLLVFS